MCKEYKAYTVTPHTHRPSLYIQQTTSFFGPIVNFHTMITFLPVQTNKKRTEGPTPKKLWGKIVQRRVDIILNPIGIRQIAVKYLQILNRKGERCINWLLRHPEPTLQFLL